MTDHKDIAARILARGKAQWEASGARSPICACSIGHMSPQCPAHGHMAAEHHNAPSTSPVREAMVDDAVEIIGGVIEKSLIAFEKLGVFQPFCQYHGDEFIVRDEKTGEGFCNECVAEGGIGDLCHFATDSEAFDIARAIISDKKAMAALSAAIGGGGEWVKCSEHRPMNWQKVAVWNPLTGCAGIFQYNSNGDGSWTLNDNSDFQRVKPEHCWFALPEMPPPPSANEGH